MKQGGFQILSWHNCGTSGEDIKILRILEAARGKNGRKTQRRQKKVVDPVHCGGK